jgi:hypothetical protein
MNADALILALVALADLAVLVYLRRRHRRRERARRMMRSLQFAIRREIAVTDLRASCNAVHLTH